MKPVLTAVAFLATCSAAAGAQEFRLPFEGRWFVAQGGDTPNVNHHMSLRAQWYGVDFARVGGPEERSLTRTDGRTLEDFYSWGQPVLAPAAGEVLAVVNDLPDNPLGTRDPDRPAGNHVVIAISSDRFVFLGHLQNGSITVQPGDRVQAGQEIGRCGNSGNSDFPHLHMHVQDTPTLNEGAGQNMLFTRIGVELTGKRFTAVDWPMIRGLFVWPE